MKKSVQFDLLRKLLKGGQPVRYRVFGSSMWPMIQDGDVLFISPGPWQTLRLGDVVAALHPAAGQPVVHRIVAMKKNFIRLQGDNLPFHDGAIPVQQILGKVQLVMRNGRRVRWGLGSEKHLMRIAGRGRPGFPLLRFLWFLFHRRIG